MDTRLHRSWPDIRPEDRRAVLAALDRGALSGADVPELAALEQEFAGYLGAAHCVALNSGTAALHCCLAAAGVGPGDEVVVPAISFVATAMAVMHQRAAPVFCDVAPSTFNIDPARVPERLSPRTRAIVVVHLHGMPADLPALRSIADRHGLALIEDCAQAPGAAYGGAKVGNWGATAAFSLQATKNLPGGDGGLFVTGDEQAYRTARRLSQFGEDVPAPRHGGDRVYWSWSVGWNYRAHVLAAALARSRLRRLDDYNETARRNAGTLTAHLRGVAGLRPPHEPGDRTGVFHKYRVVIERGAFDPVAAPVAVRQALLSALRAEGVATGLWQHWPLPAHPVFRRRSGGGLAQWDPDELPWAREILERSLIVGSEAAPLMVQEPALMEQYGAAIAKVAGALRDPGFLRRVPADPALPVPP